MTADEIRGFLKGIDDEWLFRNADGIRRQVFGSEVYLRGVIEFSNCCVNRCLYCGIRGPNLQVKRYRMESDEILPAAALAAHLGIGTVVLQSGDDFHYKKNPIGRIIENIKKELDVAITLSLGDRTEDELRFWKDCGADRYLLKIETFNRELYEKLRPGSRVRDRIGRIELLGKLGYEVGSGIIADLPGMTLDLMAQDIVRLTEFDLDMIAVGPFVPHPDTPLAGEPTGNVLTALRTVALIRLANPLANIPATSAFSSVEPLSRSRALLCGANVLMPSVTPEEIRKHYTIYPGKNEGPSMVVEHIAECKRMIEAAGFVPSSAKGFSKRRNHGQSSTWYETRNHHTRTQECR